MSKNTRKTGVEEAKCGKAYLLIQHAMRWVGKKKVRSYNDAWLYPLFYALNIHAAANYPPPPGDRRGGEERGSIQLLSLKKQQTEVVVALVAKQPEQFSPVESV